MVTSAEGAAPNLSGKSAVERKLHVKSASRAMDLVEFFHDTRKPARVFEVAQALGMPNSSACELLKTLMASGHLNFDDRLKTYFPSYRMVRIASWLNEAYGQAKFDDMVNALALECGETIALTAQSGTSMQIMALQSGRGDAPNMLIEGSRVPIIASISGAALLMAKSNNDTQKIISKSIHLRGNDRKKSAISGIMRQVNEFRMTGYAFTQQTAFYDTISVAVPLPLYAAPMQLVLGCGGPPARMNGRASEIGKTMRDVVNRYFH